MPNRPEPRRRLARYPWAVLLAVLPVYAGAAGRYGLRVLAILGLSVLTGALVDCLAFRLRQDPAPRWSWTVWLVLPLLLPAGLPLWQAPVGLAFALVFAMHFLGGFGRTLFPVAATAVVFLTLSYPVPSGQVSRPFDGPAMGFPQAAPAAPAPGRPLPEPRPAADLSSPSRPAPREADGPSLPAPLTGEGPEPLGAAAGYLALLVPAMLATGFLDPRFGLPALLAAVLAAALGHHCFPARVLPPLRQLMSGGFLLALAVVVPSEPSALPRTPEGRRLGGALFGLLTVVIRGFSTHGEGVWFALLLSAGCSPLIDQVVGERLYGRREPAQ